MRLSIAYFDTTFDVRGTPPNVYAYQPDPEVAQNELVGKDWFVLGEAADFLQSALSLSSDALPTISIPLHDSQWIDFAAPRVWGLYSVIQSEKTTDPTGLFTAPTHRIME